MMNIMEVYKMNENILIENAILAFLHHYPEHNWVNAVSYTHLTLPTKA